MSRSVYHLYVIRVPDGSRDTLQEHLKANGISTGIHYPIALPYLNAYSYLGHRGGDFQHSLKASGEILSLPMFPELTAEQVEYVAERLRVLPASENSPKDPADHGELHADSAPDAGRRIRAAIRPDHPGTERGAVHQVHARFDGSADPPARCAG